MTSFVDDHLWGLVSQVEPTATQKDGAQRSHRFLRETLNTGQMANRISESYLSGSYARDTAIYPLDDVDVIFEIQANAWPTDLLAGHPSASAVLETFASAIRYRYPVSSVYGQRRSVRLQLYHLDIDVVPAISASEDRKLILVPDRETGGWVKSSPKRHSENATRINQRYSGRFKPLVKLLKLWNSKLPETVRCKSFLLETMAVRIFDGVNLASLEEAAIYFWDFIAAAGGESSRYAWKQSFGMNFDWLSVTVPDAAGTGTNVAARMTYDHIKALASRARISREKLESAQRSRTILGQAGFVSEAFRM